MPPVAAHPKLHATTQRVVGFVLLTFVAVLVGPGVAAQDRSLSERRVALVVGNSSYKSSPLKNPANDARAMAAALRKLNFEVIERQNVTRESFALVAREYGDRLKGATVGLFYFAGHGLQVRGRNYLVPVDADIAREDEVPYRSLDVNEVLDKMDSARTPINLVLLDACRNNPFARSFKLSQVGLAQMDAPAGTLIAFATSPGSVAQDGEGSNGLYTGALLRHMSAEALPIEQMLKKVRVDVARASNNAQVPWESSSLNRDFSFVPGAAAALQPAAPPVPAGAATAATELALELAFWDAIKNSSNPADYRAYLEQHPQGRFAALARLRAAVGNPQPVVTTIAPAPAAVAASTTAPIRVASPEGLYVATATGSTLVLTAQGDRVVIRTIAYDTTGGFVTERVRFSPDGRWLLVSGQRDRQAAQILLDVSTGAMVWERAAPEAGFEANQPVVTLRLPDGRVDALALRPGG